MLLLLHHGVELLPLVLRQIAPGWVMGAGVEQNDLLVLEFQEIVTHSLEVDSLS